MALLLKSLSLLMLAGALLAVPRPQAAPEGEGGAYELPADAETILSEKPIKKEFSCADRPYGYYADTANNCEIFHICLPIQNEAGETTSTSQWSFVCGNQTIFDQETLTCNHKDDALPCSEAETKYGAVEFGKVPERRRK